MLIKQNNYQANDVVSIRTNSGEEIIGRYIEADATTITLAKPLVISLQPVDNGRVGLALLPLMTSADMANNFQFPKSCLLVLPTKSKDELAKEYTARTSSIAIPTAAQSSLIR